MLYTGGEDQAEASITSNNASLIQVVNSSSDGGQFAEKVDRCPLNRGRQVHLGPQNLYVVGCLLLKGCLSIEVNGRTVGTFRIVRYIVGVCCRGVSIKQSSIVPYFP